MSDRTEGGISQTLSSAAVSVILPTYNERDNIAGIVHRILDSLECDVEILVVDDDSPDKTWQLARQEFEDDPRVRVIRRRNCEKGLSQSVQRGFTEASGEYVAVMDADYQHPPETLVNLFGALDGGADIAVGSRYGSGGGVEDWSRSREYISRGTTLATRLVLPSARCVSDPLSGFFAVRREAIEDLHLEPKGYKILLEILSKSVDLEVVEIPFVFQNRHAGESKLDATECGVFVRHLSELTINHHGGVITRAGKFGVVGASGAFLNMIVFTMFTMVGGWHFMLAGVGAFLAAVNWNFAGNWVFTYDGPPGNLFQQYTRFHLVATSGFIVYALTLALMGVIGFHLLISNAVAIGAGALFNFVGTEQSVFTRSEERSPIS